MRVFKSLGLAAILAFTGSSMGLRAQPTRTSPRAVAGEFIVKYRHTASAAARGDARRSIGATAVAALNRHAEAVGDQGAMELVRVASAAAQQTAVQRLRGHAAVEYVEPNWIYTHQATDPLFVQQWGLENSGQAVSGMRGTADADIDAAEAWATAPAASRQVYVGVIDEGIDFTHADLAGAVWTNPYDLPDGLDNDGNGYVDDIHGWDFVANDNSVYDGDATYTGIDWHGTHAAGTIAARRDNGIGVSGIAADVTIIPAKFLGIRGGSTAGAILALDYLTDLKKRHHLNIVATNNSWGGGGYSEALLEAITRAAREDILFVVAAGNGDEDHVGDDNDMFPSYPANYDTSAGAGYDAVISVTATGQSDELADFGNYGANTVHIGAPGDLIASTTPQNGYMVSSGTSMAAPHVTGAAAFMNGITGIAGARLRAALLDAVDPLPGLTGRTVSGGRLNLARLVSTPVAGPASVNEIVLLATDADTMVGNWTVRTDSSAAGGARLQSTSLGAAKVSPALAAPAHYFELTFTAEAGRPYHLWVRGRAENNGWANDSVHVQFDATVDRSGTAVHRIGTTSSEAINLEDCGGCGLSGWTWQDNGYGAGVLGSAIYFASSGPQRMRIQTREDGIGIDQIVLSPALYLSSSPGALKDDTTLLTTSPVTAPSAKEVALYASDASLVAGAWTRVADSTAAGGTRLQNVNAAAAKIATAQPDPADYFELTFRADAGKVYRLWIRGKASSNNWANDSVHVQFSDTVTAAGAPIYRIASTSAAEVNLEDCSGCGLSGWGWQDNGYGAGVLGPEIRFAITGLHTIRVQVREDGIGIDQIVLSAAAYFSAAPGAQKNDSVILPRTQ